MEIKALLNKLSKPAGVSGAEEEILNVIEEMLTPLGNVRRDNMNNLKCTFGEGYHFLLDAHIDEIGLIVTSITDDGFIKFDKCGGIDLRMLPGSEVIVLAKKRLFGVISSLPPHLTAAGDEKKTPDIKSLSIDTGYEADVLKTIVSAGDRIIFKRNCSSLLGNQVSMSCLDDRSGAAAIITAIKLIKESGVKCRVTALFSVQEELGTRGGKIGAFNENIDEAISVDVSFAYSPGCDKTDCGIIGSGPMIGISPVLDKDMTDSIIKTAADNSIKYQLEVMSGNTGTNADALSVTQSGIKTALISIPEKYMHTPVEVVSCDDVENTAELIAAYVIGKAGEINA